MHDDFYSHGKLLITGEYLILKGASALATPVNFGQSIEVRNNNQASILKWNSFELDKPWFNCSIDTQNHTILNTSNNEIAEKLLQLFLITEDLKPGFLETLGGKEIISRADFNLQWGLGSSSTLISNIAHISQTDPMQLHRRWTNGSGYDVVCATAGKPIFFQLKHRQAEWKTTRFFPAFHSQLYFVYLGKKQDSLKSVKKFMKSNKSLKNEIKWISELTLHIASAASIDDLNYYLHEHEIIISSVLKEQPIKNKFFHDFKGMIKSLGAWGGDFCLVSWEGDPDFLIKYFANYKLNTIIEFEQMIIPQ